MEVTNRYVTIKSQVEGKPKESDFELKTSNISLSLDPGSNNIVVKNLYVSIDRFQINRMKSHSSSQKALALTASIIPGEVIHAYGVAKVVASGNPEFEFDKDDLVVGFITCGEYSLLKGGDYMLRKCDSMGFPLEFLV